MSTTFNVNILNIEPVMPARSWFPATKTFLTFHQMNR
jgi:hypothetical protein